MTNFIKIYCPVCQGWLCRAADGSVMEHKCSSRDCRQSKQPPFITRVVDGQAYHKISVYQKYGERQIDIDAILPVAGLVIDG